MRLLTPPQGVSRPLHLFLIFELPILIISLALFAWAIDAISTALKFQQRAGNWDATNVESGWGFELGTQLYSRTRTWTGTSPLQTVLSATRSVVVSGQTRQSLTVSTRTTGISTGTFTSTYQNSIFPGYFGTAFYSDVYASAGVKPTELPRASSTTPSFINRAAVPTAAPVQRRDADWAGGDTYESTHNGLYDIYDDAESDFKLYIGLFSGCLAVIALRILATIGYLVISALNKAHSPKKSLALSNTVLAFAYIAWITLCGLGVTAWVSIGRWQGLGESSVQATLAFYIITALSSFVVLCMASRSAKKIKRSIKENRHLAGSNNVKNGESSSSVGQHAA